MNRLLSRLFGSSRMTKPANKVKSSRPRLSFDVLESRVVPSISSTDFVVPTTTANNQFESANASSSSGLGVVVWTHRYSATDTDIYAQMYNTNGSKRGGEIHVATSGLVEGSPAVAMDNGGEWKVVWVRNTTSTNRDIFAARYSSSGVKMGSTITVAGGSKNEYAPSIANDYIGNFVVSYTLDFSSSDQDIQARMYTDGGVFQKSIAVSTTSAADEIRSVVTRSTGSNAVFAIGYQTGSDITLKRYSSTGTLVNTHLIAVGSNSQQYPSASMDASGNTVVAWQEFIGAKGIILARKVSSTGVMGSTVTIVNSSASASSASVVMNRTNGTFVVAFQYNSTVYVREMNSNLTPKTGFLSCGLCTSIASPKLSIDSHGNYLVTYTDVGRGVDTGFGVYGRFGHL